MNKPDDDFLLWQQVAESVKPLRAPKPAASAKKAHAAKADAEKQAKAHGAATSKPAPDILGGAVCAEKNLNDMEALMLGAASTPVLAPVSAPVLAPVSAPPKLPRPLPPIPPLDAALRLAIREGRWSLARLDLHGFHETSAHQMLIDFVQQHQQSGTRALLIITGKGSALSHDEAAEREKGALRRMVPLWLEAPSLRPLIRGLEPALRQHGGSGAYYVVLNIKK